MGDSSVINEIKTEIIEIEYNCIHCQKSFFDIDELDYHEKINHVIIKEEPDWVIDEQEETISNKKPGFEKLEEHSDWVIDEEAISNKKPRFEKLEENPDWVIDEEEEPLSNKPRFEKLADDPDWVIDEEPISNKKPGFEKLEDPDWVIDEEEQPISKKKPIFKNLKEDKRPFSCSKCPESFYNTASLYNHNSSCHKTPKYKCHLCEKAFVLRSHHIDHIEDHKNLRKFKCYHCSKAFNTNKALLRHQRTKGVLPKKNKKFNCDVCGDNFRTGAEVITHCVKKHSMNRNDLKPYKCTICSLAYSSSYEMSHHKRKHKK